MRVPCGGNSINNECSIHARTEFSHPTATEVDVSAAKPGGRPRTAYELEQLVVRLARENPAWGNARVAGELNKLGYSLSDETVATILKRHGIPPAPERHWSPQLAEPDGPLP
jgi:transposase